MLINFCDVHYEGLTKTSVLVLRGGGVVRKNSNMPDVIYEQPLGLFIQSIIADKHGKDNLKSCPNLPNLPNLPSLPSLPNLPIVSENEFH